MSDLNLNEPQNNNNHIMSSLFGQNIAHELMNHNQISDKQLGGNHEKQEYKATPIFEQRSEQMHENHQNSFDQKNYNNINSNFFHTIPHYFPMKMNPQIQKPQNRSKILHIDEMNKSVKQIMRCNKEYRGQLLSAYQNKSKIQLQNVILLKEKQNMEQEKQAIYAQLDQSKQKVVILENYIDRLKNNHKKINDKLKQEIEELHNELTQLRNTKYDLQNMSNENKLFIQRMQSHQNKIKELQLQLQKTSHEQLQGNNNYSLLNEKYSNLNNEKNHLLIVTLNQKKVIQNMEERINKQSQQNEKLNKNLKGIEWRYESVSKQYQYERKRNQQLLEKLDRLQMDNQDFNKELIQNQQQYNQLMQEYINIKSQNDGLRPFTIQFHTVKEVNRSYIEQLKRKQDQTHELKDAYTKLTQQIHRISSQYCKIKDQYAFYKEVTAIQAQNCIKGFQAQISSLDYNHDSSVRALMSTIQQAQQENDRLRTVLLKKQEFINAKEKQISHHIEEITELQSKSTILSKEIIEKNNQLLTKQAKIRELQTQINKNHQFASSLQQIIVQLRGQNVQNRKKQIIKMAQKDSFINGLHQDLTNTNNQKEKTLQKLSQQQKQKEQARKRFDSLYSQLNQQVNQLRNKVQSQQKTIKDLHQQLNQKSATVERQKYDISNLNITEQKLRLLNQNLKDQIQVIEAQYADIENRLKDAQGQKELIAQKLSQQQKYKDKLMRINQKYLAENQQLKIKLNLIQSKNINAKKYYQSQISQLSEQLSTVRLDHQKMKIATDSLQAIYKIIHNVQEMQRAMLLDPKISIARFSSHITALHRPAFIREVQKVKIYLASVMHVGEEIKGNMELLKLNVNAIYKGFQITFSEKRPRSLSKI